MGSNGVGGSFEPSRIMGSGTRFQMGSAKGRVQFGEARSFLRGGRYGLLAIPAGASWRTRATLSEEERFVLLGFSRDKRLLAVMFVDRGESIRIISARVATRRERRDYEEDGQ